MTRVAASGCQVRGTAVPLQRWSSLHLGLAPPAPSVTTLRVGGAAACRAVSSTAPNTHVYHGQRRDARGFTIARTSCVAEPSMTWRHALGQPAPVSRPPASVRSLM
jgi:hypothetical protein